MKLTGKILGSLSVPAGKSEAIFFDDDVPGFGLRIRDGGSRTFVFQYKLGAKQRRMALGAVTAVDIGQARKTAKLLYARVTQGHDPAGDKAEAKVLAAQTFAAAAFRRTAQLHRCSITTSAVGEQLVARKYRVASQSHL